MSIERAALLGAETFLGRSVEERMREQHVTVGRLARAEPGSDHALITAVGGELVLSTPRVAETIEGASLIYCCTPLAGEDANLVKAAAAHALVLDLTGSLGAPPCDARAARPPRIGLWTSPTGSSLVVAALARSAAKAGARGPLAATVMEGASELGKEALDELYQQALACLSFSPVPTEVFGRQAVHDIASPAPQGHERELRLRSEVDAMAGAGNATLIVAQAGTFHGAAIAAWAPVDEPAWRKQLANEPRLQIRDDEPASPLSSVRSELSVVGRLAGDGRGGTWCWAAVDTLAQGSVGNAVDLAARLAGAAAGKGKTR